MNEFILVAMNRKNHTQEELDENRAAAADAADAAWDAKRWVNKYFERTGEDKQVYIDALKPKPAQPVFTQAMADNGEPPVVGMKVKHLSVDKLVMLPADANSKYVLKSVDDMYSLALLHDIKPIDTRTNKAKAFDDKVEHLTNEGIVTYDNIMLKILIEKFIGSKIHCVKWVGE